MATISISCGKDDQDDDNQVPQWPDVFTFGEEEVSFTRGFYSHEEGASHHLFLMSEDLQLAQTVYTLSGNGHYANVNITTDTNNIGSIVGSFSPYDNGTYSWKVVSVMAVENGELTGTRYRFENISKFIITKEGEIYSIAIMGNGAKETADTTQSGDMELRYTGNLDYVG